MLVPSRWTCNQHITLALLMVLVDGFPTLPHLLGPFTLPPTNFYTSMVCVLEMLPITKYNIMWSLVFWLMPFIFASATYKSILILNFQQPKSTMSIPCETHIYFTNSYEPVPLVDTLRPSHSFMSLKTRENFKGEFLPMGEF